MSNETLFLHFVTFSNTQKRLTHQFFNAKKISDGIKLMNNLLEPQLVHWKKASSY